VIEHESGVRTLRRQLGSGEDFIGTHAEIERKSGVAEALHRIDERRREAQTWWPIG
jgi:hypothetical protein